MIKHYEMCLTSTEMGIYGYRCFRSPCMGNFRGLFTGIQGFTVSSLDSLLRHSSCCNEINANVTSINKSHTSFFNLSALM